MPAHQIDVAHGPARIARQRRGPDQAGGAVAEQVGGHDGNQVVHAGEDTQHLRLAPTVAGLVEVETHAVAVQVDDVGGAGAVDVGQSNALVIELVRVVEMGRMVHRHLGAEPAVAEVRPVADLAVADADEIGEAVAAQVCEIDGLGAVGKHQAGAFFFIQRLMDAAGWTEALLGQRGVPDEGVVFGNQHVGVTVAVQVNEFQVGVAHVAVEARGEGAEGLPAFLFIVLIEARHGAIQHHQIRLAVAGEVHELRLPASQGQVGLGGNEFQRREFDRRAC